MKELVEYGEYVAELFRVQGTIPEVRNQIQFHEIMCVCRKYPGSDRFLIFFEDTPGGDSGFLIPVQSVKSCDELQVELDGLRHKWAVEDRLDSLKTMPYSEYLQTKEWRDKRARKLEASGYACQICNSAGVQLDVHHRTYERRGAEADGDLIVLCHSCHWLFHRAGKIVRED